MGFLKAEKYFILKIFIIAVIIGIIYTLAAPPRSISFDDAVSWDAVAKNILAGKGFVEIDNTPTSIRPPIYPLFISVIYWLFGTGLISLKITQVVLNSCTVCVTYMITKELFGIKISKITGIILCIYPPLLVYTGIIGSETLFILLLTLVIYAIIIWIKNNQTRTVFFAGIGLGFADLCRSTAILYPLFLLISALIVYYGKAEFNKRIKDLLIFFVLSIIIVLPWTLRNYLVFGKFLLVNTSSAELFWSGTYGPWDGVCITNRDKHFYELFDNNKIKNPVELERIMFKEGVKNIVNSPACFLKLTVKKFLRFWFQPVGQVLVSGRSRFIGFSMYAVHFAWIVFAIYGFIVSRKERILYLPLTVLFMYFTVMHNIIPPIARYRLPIEPYIMIFAVYGLVNLISGRRVIQNV